MPLAKREFSRWLPRTRDRAARARAEVELRRLLGEAEELRRGILAAGRRSNGAEARAPRSTVSRRPRGPGGNAGLRAADRAGEWLSRKVRPAWNAVLRHGAFTMVFLGIALRLWKVEAGLHLHRLSGDLLGLIGMRSVEASDAVSVNVADGPCEVQSVRTGVRRNRGSGR